MSNSMQPLRRVPQRDWDHNDCGLACVAMVTRIPYETVLSAFRKLPNRERSSSFYTYHCELEAMLQSLGGCTQRNRFHSWRQLTTHSIVKVNAKKNGSWHWVVFDGGRPYAAAHDPKPGKRHVITDFRGLKGSGHYIAVVPNSEL